MDPRLEERLAALEAVLDAPPVAPARLRAALQAMSPVTGREPADVLLRIWRVAFRVLHIPGGGAAAVLHGEITGPDHERVVRLARRLIERTFYDVHAIRRGALPVAGAAPAGTSAWDEARARRNIGPYLSRFEAHIAHDPTVHLPLLWAVLAAGYEPFRTILTQWVTDGERRGLGLSGAIAATHEAGRIVADATARTFDACESARMMALLKERNPLLPWAAATWLGRFLYHGGHGGPALGEILAHIARLGGNRAVAAAAFAIARDDMFGPGSPAYPDRNPARHPLAAIGEDMAAQAGFDLGDWVLAVLALHEDEPWLPFGESFVGLVASHFAEDPAFATRLLEEGHQDVALALATCLPQYVAGMEPVLQRIQEEADEPLATAAADHLGAHYGPDADRDPTGFASRIGRLEAGIDAGDFDRVLDAMRALEVPAEPAAADLQRFYRALYRVLGIGDGSVLVLAHDADGEGLSHLRWVAQSMIERTLYDAEAHTRAHIRRSVERARARGRTPGRYADESRLPPELTIPFTAEEAGEALRPFLDGLARGARREPTAHMRLLWQVWQDGYPACRAALARWLDGLEADGVGEAGTRAALDAAVRLHRQVEAIRDGEEGREDDVPDAIVPLLDHPHPLLAAHAHRYAGALYKALGDDAGAGAAGLPPLTTFVTALARQTRHRAVSAGAFVDGFSEGYGGFDPLLRDPRLSGFDVDGWVVDVLAGSEEADIPGTQAFWFYVHEAYADRPDLAHRLIDAGDAFTAFMCATEIDPPSPGMLAVLRRLAEGEDAELGRRAEAVLARYA